MPYYTGGEIITKYLIKEGVKYVIGILGHGNLPLVDAFYRDRDKLQLIKREFSKPKTRNLTQKFKSSF